MNWRNVEQHIVSPSQALPSYKILTVPAEKFEHLAHFWTFFYAQHLSYPQCFCTKTISFLLVSGLLTFSNNHDKSEVPTDEQETLWAQNLLNTVPLLIINQLHPFIDRLVLFNNAPTRSSGISDLIWRYVFAANVKWSTQLLYKPWQRLAGHESLGRPVLAPAASSTSTTDPARTFLRPFPALS